MGPVKDATLGVPFVFATEINSVTLLETLDVGRHIDIMSNKNGLARVEAEDEVLVTVPLQVVGENLVYFALATNDEVALFVCEGVLQDLVTITVYRAIGFTLQLLYEFTQPHGEMCSFIANRMNTF